MRRLFLVASGAAAVCLFAGAALGIASRPNYCWAWEPYCEIDWASWAQLLGVAAAVTGIWFPIWHATRQQAMLRRHALFSAMDAANQVFSGLTVLLENIQTNKPVPSVWMSMLDLPAETLRGFQGVSHLLTSEEQKWLRLLAMQTNAGRVAAMSASTELDPPQWTVLEGHLEEAVLSARGIYDSFKAAADAHEAAMHR